LFKNNLPFSAFNKTGSSFVRRRRTERAGGDGAFLRQQKGKKGKIFVP